MQQFSPNPKPKSGELWVDHAGDLPTSDTIVFLDHLRTYEEALGKKRRSLQQSGRYFSHQVVSTAETMLAAAAVSVEKWPTEDPAYDRKSAYAALCALGMGTLVDRFFNGEASPLLGLVEIGMLRMVPEVRLDFNNEEEPARYSLHVSRELLAPLMATQLPERAEECWYAANGLSLLYQSPANPVEGLLVGEDITPQEVTEFFAGTCTIRPFLPAP